MPATCNHACNLFREKVSGTFPPCCRHRHRERHRPDGGWTHKNVSPYPHRQKGCRPFEPCQESWTHNGPTGGHTAGHTIFALVSILRPRMTAACMFYREAHIQELKHSPPAPAVLKGKAPRQCIPTRGFMRASCPTWDSGQKSERLPMRSAMCL